MSCDLSKLSEVINVFHIHVMCLYSKLLCRCMSEHLQPVVRITNQAALVHNLLILCSLPPYCLTPGGTLIHISHDPHCADTYSRPLLTQVTRALPGVKWLLIHRILSPDCLTPGGKLEHKSHDLHCADTSAHSGIVHYVKLNKNRF